MLDKTDMFDQSILNATDMDLHFPLSYLSLCLRDIWHLEFLCEYIHALTSRQEDWYILGNLFYKLFCFLLAAQTLYKGNRNIYVKVEKTTVTHKIYHETTSTRDQ